MSKAVLLLIMIAAFASSCKKDDFITGPGAQVTISADTIKFDTVFTTAGSVTRSFKIFNENEQKLLVSEIKLMGGSASSYAVNINGAYSPSANNVEIAANDSIYIFVSVTIDPTSATTPFIIQDSILISYNGTNRFVQLQAFGQNANFLSGAIISEPTIWNSDLPYVLLDGLYIEPDASLTISAGTEVFVHANSPVIVDGSLILNGTADEPVIFAGSRLDIPYKDHPASWPGITFRQSSINNYFRFATIKNAYQAITILSPSINSNPKLTVEQSIIHNAYEAGIYAENSSFKISNSLISNCGKNVTIVHGGIYEIIHCTLASYTNQYLDRKNPVLSISDSREVNGTIESADLNVLLQNNIFWGDDNWLFANEVVTEKKGTGLYNVNMDHCLYKGTGDPLNVSFNAVIKNINPGFDSINVVNNYFDFRLIKNPFSPAVDNGTVTSYDRDLDNNPRNIIIPDIGCYERQ